MEDMMDDEFEGDDMGMGGMEGLEGDDLGGIDMMMESPGGTTLKGELTIEIVEANNLTNKESSDIVGDVSDPYAAIFLDSMEENRTKVVKDNLNPKWNEKFIVVVNGTYEDIYVQVFDFDPKKVLSDHLGYASISMALLEDEQPHDVWIKLAQNKVLTGVSEKDVVSGSLHVKFRFCAEGNEKKREADDEKRKADEELKKAEEEAKKAKEMLEKAKEEARAEAQKEAEEKQKKAEEARKKQIEAAKKAAEELKKAKEAAQERAKAEKERAESILKEKREAEKKLQEAMKQLAEAKKLMKEKERSEHELRNKILDEKEKERKEREEEVSKKNKEHNVDKPPVSISICDHHVKSKDLAKPENIFVENMQTIAAGGSNKMYATDPSGKIYMVDKNGNKTRIPGILSVISASEDGTVMGTDRDSCIWNWNGSNWNQIRGRLYHISVGNRDNVWGICPGDTVWKFDRQNGRWNRMPGSLRWLSVGEDGEVWGIDRKGRCLRWAFDSWRNSGLKHAEVVTVSSKNNVWALAKGGILHQFEGDKWEDHKQWGTFSFVETTDKGLYVVSKNNVYVSNATSSKSKSLTDAPAVPSNIVSGKLKYIANSSCAVWGLDDTERIWYRKPHENRWTERPGLLSMIDVGADGETWGINKYKQAFRWSPINGQWVHSPGQFNNIAVGSEKHVYAIGARGNIWKAQNGKWFRMPGKAVQLSAGFDDELWARTANGALYSWKNNGWRRVNAPAAVWISVASSKYVVMKNASNGNWSYWDGTTWHPFSSLDGKNIKCLSVDKDGVVWVVDNTNNIFSSKQY